jgi:RNA polymerase sigma factor (sigma-70 family)
VDDGFKDLLKGVQSGSPAATRRLIERYGPHILRAVRRRLDKSIRAKFDSFDFAQAVWASFFSKFEDADKFEGPERFIGYLATIAQNKVINEMRRRTQTEKYNINRERSLDDSRTCLAGGLVESTPSPSQLAIADELWSRMLEGSSERHRQILELRRTGHTNDEIARQLEVNEKTVRRTINKIAQRWTL